MLVLSTEMGRRSDDAGFTRPLGALGWQPAKPHRQRLTQPCEGSNSTRHATTPTIRSHHPAVAPKGLWRMIGRQVRSRRDRSIALGAGILVASANFSLLTADASTRAIHRTVAQP